MRLLVILSFRLLFDFIRLFTLREFFIVDVDPPFMSIFTSYKLSFDVCLDLGLLFLD